MKIFTKISLIAVLLVNSVGLYAAEGDLAFKLKRVNEKAVTFFIDETQVVDVFIYDATEALMYEQKINAVKGSTKTYDLNSLPDGNYILKLNTDSKSAAYKIALKDGKVSVSAPVIVNLLNPVLKKEKDIVTLNLDNLTDGSVEIQILDRFSEPLYQEVFKADSSFVKKFDVARIGMDELTFVIKSADQVISRTIRII